MWNNGACVLAILLDQSNVATFFLAGNYASYDAFMAKAEVGDHNNDPPCLKNPAHKDYAMDAEVQVEIWTTPEGVDFGDDSTLVPEDKKFDRGRQVEREYLNLHVAANHLPHRER